MNDPLFQIKDVLFRVLLGLTTVLFLGAAIVYDLTNVETFANIMYCNTVILALTRVWNRLKPKYQNIQIASFLIVFYASIFGVGLFVAGIGGIIPLALTCITILSISITDKKLAPLFIGLGVFMVVAFLLIHLYHPDWIGSYDTDLYEIQEKTFMSIAAIILAGTVMWLFVSTNDKSRHRILEEKELLETTQQASKTGYWEFNLKNQKAFMSEVTKDICGVDRNKELSLEESMSLYHPESLPIVQKAFGELVEKNTPFDLTVKLLKGHKELIWVRVIGKMHYENGLSAKAFGTIQDVTELKRQDEILAEQKFLKQEAESKSSFLAQMSHEIRTPLNGIVGIIDMMHKDETDPAKKELLETVLGSSNDLVTIVSDVLNLSKLEAGKESINLSDFDLKEIILKSVDLYKEKALLKNIDLKYVPSYNKNIVVRTDRLKMTQVMNNFISNAIKFTSEGSVTVTCKGIENNLLIEVSDSGRGIREREIEKVFDKFQQTSDSIIKKTEGTEEGTGLGLQICKLLIELMGGEVGVRSTYGEGSTFWFKIPVEFVSVSEKKEIVAEERQAELLDISVLLVDDKAINLKVARLMLHKLGCKVETAENGEVAVMKAIEQSNNYDLILMDIQMPVMNGIVATAEIKRVLGDLAPPIIALTAKNMEGDREDLISKGLDDFIAKPVKKGELEKKIRQVLSV